MLSKTKKTYNDLKRQNDDLKHLMIIYKDLIMI